MLYRNLKRLARRPLGALALFALRWSGRSRGAALIYHRLSVESWNPERELVPQHGKDLFEAQLRYLRRWCRVVPATGLTAAVAGRRRGQRIPVAITFDDDLSSHRALAAPILGSLGLPATFFVTGATLSGPHAFWWEHLQTAVDRGHSVETLVPPPALATAREGSPGIREVAGAIEAMLPAERAAVAESLRSLVGPDSAESGLRAQDLRQIADAGFEIGFHTLRHDRLTLLQGSDLDHALSDGREAIEAVIGTTVTTIAYPHGRADEGIAVRAREAGYRFGFTGRWEPVRPQADPLLLGRFEPSFDSVGELAIQLTRLLRFA